MSAFLSLRNASINLFIESPILQPYIITLVITVSHVLCDFSENHISSFNNFTVELRLRKNCFWQCICFDIIVFKRDKISRRHCASRLIFTTMTNRNFYFALSTEISLCRSIMFRRKIFYFFFKTDESVILN